MKWLLPWNWSALVLRVAGLALLLLGLHFGLKHYYIKEIKAKTEAAAVKANIQKLERETANKDKALNAKNAQIKTLEAIAADGKRIADANQRLQLGLRASEASKTDLRACLQRADSLDNVQRAVSEFAGRVVQECDRHITDKINLKAAWPE